MSKILKTYLDESGSTGKNLLDLKQSFLTLGAVVIEDKKLDKFKNIFTSLPDELREKGEVKGNNIACYKQDIAVSIISDILPVNAEIFFFSVVEKRFMIAGQIVENFFDYAYNDNTDVSWSYKSETKIKLANFFYSELSDETIRITHNAFISCKIEDITNSFNEISKEVKGATYDFDIFKILSGAEKHLEELSKVLSQSVAKNSISKGVPKHTISTPNVTAYFEILGRIETYLEEINSTSQLHFDNSEQYNKIFKILLLILKKS